MNITTYIFHCVRSTCLLAAADPILFESTFCSEFSVIAPLRTPSRSTIPSYFNLFAPSSYDTSVQFLPSASSRNFLLPTTLSLFRLSSRFTGTSFLQLDFLGAAENLPTSLLLSFDTPISIILKSASYSFSPSSQLVNCRPPCTFPCVVIGSTTFSVPSNSCSNLPM
ncbi:hypothetical protein V6Z12_A11G087800 [Gossypium hirsutum]